MRSRLEFLCFALVFVCTLFVAITFLRMAVPQGGYRPMPYFESVGVAAWAFWAWCAGLLMTPFFSALVTGFVTLSFPSKGGQPRRNTVSSYETLEQAAAKLPGRLNAKSTGHPLRSNLRLGECNFYPVAATIVFPDSQVDSWMREARRLCNDPFHWSLRC